MVKRRTHMQVVMERERERKHAEEQIKKVNELIKSKGGWKKASDEPYGEHSDIQKAIRNRKTGGKQCPIPVRTYCVKDYNRSGKKVSGYCVKPHMRKCR
jgi:hypothetical protein